MKKIITVVTLILALTAMIFVFSSCSEDKDGKNSEKVKVLTLKGPTGLGMLDMMETGSDLYDISVYSSPEEIRTEIILGEYDIASLPVNLASLLYSKTEKSFSVPAINTLGVLYIVTSDENINSLEDLRGKTLYCTGAGSTPEYTLRYILEKNDIDPDKDINLDFSFSEHSELAAFVAEGSCEVAMLPEPNVSSALASGKGKVRIAIDLNEEWNKISDSALVQGCVIAKKEFIENRPKEFEKFLDDYNESVEKVNSSPKEASLLAEKFGIIPKAPLAEKAIPNCNIVFIDGDEMKKSLSDFLNVLYDYSPSSVGGKLPDGDFYYTK